MFFTKKKKKTFKINNKQEKNTSILFIEPIDVIAGDFLLTFNCNISSWMN